MLNWDTVTRSKGEGSPGIPRTGGRDLAPLGGFVWGGFAEITNRRLKFSDQEGYTEMGVREEAVASTELLSNRETMFAAWASGVVWETAQA